MKEIKKVIIVIIIALFLLWCVFVTYCINNYIKEKEIKNTYYSIDDKNNSEEVAEYLKNYMKERYEVNVTLNLIDASLLDICILYIGSSCQGHDDHDDIYVYQYSGVDEFENKFNIMYTNSYFSAGAGTSIEAEVKDNYSNYSSRKDLKKIIEEYYNVYDFYYSSFDEYRNVEYHDDLIIKIYCDNGNLKDVLEIFNKIKKIEKQVKIIATTKLDTYNSLIRLNNASYINDDLWFEPEIFSNNFLYSYIGTEKFNNKEFKPDLSFSNDDNYDYGIVFYRSGNDVQLSHAYKKEKK